MEKVSCIRGATTLKENSTEEIVNETLKLMTAIIEANGLLRGDISIVSCIISSTADIDAYYPATAVTESGILAGVPLFSVAEPNIKDTLPLCIRILVTAMCSQGFDVKHIYLNGTAKLKTNTATASIKTHERVQSNGRKIVNIAIDGPSGAGKSTIAKMLAKELGFLYLDTGAMYRAVGLKVYRSGLDCCHPNEIERLLECTEVDIRYINGTQRVFLDGEDVSDAIREHHISKIASDVSALPPVRIKMVDLQRKIALSNDSILDGRDIGTYVLPDADYKFYLTATLDQRAKRRHIELVARGSDADIEKIRQDIAARDYNDMNRDFAPLKKADDAVEIDSSMISREDTCRLMLSYIKR